MHATLRVLLGLIGAMMLGLGLTFMLAPTLLLEAFALNPEATASPPLGWSTVRGDLGGLFVTLGIALGLGTWKREKTWIYAAMLLMGSVFVGRVVGLLAHGGDVQVAINLGVEVVTVTLMALFARGLK